MSDARRGDSRPVPEDVRRAVVDAVHEALKPYDFDRGSTRWAVTYDAANAALGALNLAAHEGHKVFASRHDDGVVIEMVTDEREPRRMHLLTSPEEAVEVAQVILDAAASSAKPTEEVDRG